MIRSDLDFTILIATKDRPKELALLLDSITKSTVLPSKIVIVFTGTDMSQIAANYATTLNIELIRSEIASQIFQKSKGIEKLQSESDWILFLDDDVLVDKNAIELLINKYVNNIKYAHYAGFGLAVKNTTQRNLIFLTKLMLYAISLYAFKPGSITKSGHPQSYLLQKNNCEVSWLNGISLWRAEVLGEYSKNDLYVEYSSYEDVIFSYRLGKMKKLLFVSDVFVTSQTEAISNLPSERSFLFASYLRYYFVDKNDEFSKKWLLVAQLFRGVHFVFKPNDDSKIFSRIKISIKIWFSLYGAVIKKVNGAKLVRSKFQL